jgi:hypothetical protein
MRLWAHVIWLKKNPTTPLALCGPKEDRKLEYLIGQYGEEKVAYAWYLYVNAKPSPYNLKPVKHVDKFTTANGHIMATTVKDSSAITRFPLSAFLAVNTGFIVQSCLHIDALVEARKQVKPVSPAALAKALGISDYDGDAAKILFDLEKTVVALKATTASIKPAWGVAQEDLESDADDEF